jgi:hypothetical protein
MKESTTKKGGAGISRKQRGAPRWREDFQHKPSPAFAIERKRGAFREGQPELIPPIGRPTNAGPWPIG